MSYPSENEKTLIKAVEELMEKTMKAYDPSHDALHGGAIQAIALDL